LSTFAFATTIVCFAESSVCCAPSSAVEKVAPPPSYCWASWSTSSTYHCAWL